MKKRYSIAGLMVALLGSGVAMAVTDSDTDRSNPEAFVKDSAITTEVKAKLTADHMSSLARIHVDTDKEGVVWLSGTVESQRLRRTQSRSQSDRRRPIGAQRHQGREGRLILRMSLFDQRWAESLGLSVCSASSDATVSRQRFDEPIVAAHAVAAVASHLVCATAEAALRGGLVDEVFGRVYSAAGRNRCVFAAQMVFRPLRVVPTAIAIELATGIPDERQ